MFPFKVMVCAVFFVDKANWLERAVCGLGCDAQDHWLSPVLKWQPLRGLIAAGSVF